MKKSKVDTIFMEQAKKRNTIIAFVSAIIILLALTFLLLFMYFKGNRKYYVSYKEDANVDYKVYLKENDFFKQPYVEANKQYIASLIDYIYARFNYNLSLDDKDVEFEYSYKIVAEVNVEERDTKNSLYRFDEILLDGGTKKSKKNSSVNISENIKVDYNRYNSIIKKFVNTYVLDNTISELTIKMYVNIIGSCEDFVDDSNNNSAISISIPLTTKTMAIDISDNLVESSDNIMICKSKGGPVLLILLLFLVLLIIDVVVVLELIRYIIKNRTALDLYNKELKKILNNYHSYIQKVNSQFNLRGYQALNVDTFVDMLEIRDAISQPILMVENDNKTGVYFIIPSNTKILYIYSIKLSDFEK